MGNATNPRDGIPDDRGVDKETTGAEEDPPSAPGSLAYLRTLNLHAASAAIALPARSVTPAAPPSTLAT